MLRLHLGCNLVNLLDTQLIILLWQVVVAVVEKVTLLDQVAAAALAVYWHLLFHYHLVRLIQLQWVRVVHLSARGLSGITVVIRLFLVW
jgi:hypothetical protein